MSKTSEFFLFMDAAGPVPDAVRIVCTKAQAFNVSPFSYPA